MFAIVSQERLTKTILESGPQAPVEKRCRYDDGLEGDSPDVVGWTTLTFDGEKTTSDSEGAFRIYDLELKDHFRYYVILSAKIGDQKTIYTNSDGVFITSRDNYDDDDDDDDEYLLLLLLLLLLIPCCLLLLLLILLLVARGKGDDKYKMVVQRNG